MNFFLSDSYAIVQTSGKQLVITPGKWYDIDLIKSTILGDFLWLSKILFFQKQKKIQIGKPFLSSIKIPAKILQVVKGKKLLVVKTKPKKNYTRTRGHRQVYTRIQLDSLS
jgi:large subunit ribosomal protein L21